MFCAQFLLLSGAMFSLAALADCSFATVETALSLEGLPVTFTANLGLATFMKPDGECYWYDLGEFPEDQLDWYVRTLTNDWMLGRGFAAAGALGGFVAFVYSLSLSCSAQLRGFRHSMVFISGVTLPIIQSLSFLTFLSDFCAENECVLSRSSIFCIVSAACYFEAGLAFCQMSNYPGDALLTRERKNLAKQRKKEQTAESSFDDELAVPAEAETIVQVEEEPESLPAFGIADTTDSEAPVQIEAQGSDQVDEETEHLYVFEDSDVDHSVSLSDRGEKHSTDSPFPTEEHSVEKSCDTSVEADDVSFMGHVAPNPFKDDQANVDGRVVPNPFK